MRSPVSFEEALAMAQFLPFLGEGAYRKVYALDDSHVLKVCRSCGDNTKDEECPCRLEAFAYQQYKGLGVFAPVVAFGVCWNIQVRVQDFLFPHVCSKFPRPQDPSACGKRDDFQNEIDAMLRLLTYPRLHVGDTHGMNIGLLDGRWVYTDYQSYWERTLVAVTPSLVRKWAGLD